MPEKLQLVNWVSLLQARWQRLVEMARTPLNTPRRLYLTGFALVILGIVQGGLTSTFGAVVGLAGLGAICVGFLKEIWAKIKSLLTSSIAHRVAAALGSVVITLPCYILANHSVNLITGLAPDSFPFSITFLAISYALPVVLTTGALILGGYSAGQFLVLTWYGIRGYLGMATTIFSGERPKANMKRDLVHASRVFAAITLIGVAFYFVALYDQAEETLQQIRSEVVVYADYYPRSPCRNVVAQERVAFLKDGKISVATRKAGKWHFRFANCEAS